MMTLKEFKRIHGIVELRYKRSIAKGRIVADSELPLIVGKKTDLKQELFVTKGNTMVDGQPIGDPIFIICNQKGWEDVDIVS
jgi:hypothetical protein